MDTIIRENQGLVWLVVAVYMAVITGAGSYYARYMRSADAYFKAGNLVPWWASGISMYMANFTAYTFVAIASLVYMRGLTGLILETGPALAFAIGALFLAQRWHRLNLTSPPEYLEARFTPGTRQVFSILGIGSQFIGSGIRLLAMCKFLESVTGLPAELSIVVTALAVILYTVLGGLWAVIVTDVLQFIILLLAVIPMFILAVASIFVEGSWSEFVASIPSGFADFPNTNPEAAYGGVPVAAGAQIRWLLVFWFSYFLDYNGNWGVIQRMCCTPTDRDARRATWLAAALSLPHAFVLLGCCFIARVLWGEALADPANVQEAELVYGRTALQLLPAGLVGVVAAAMFSATMSTLNVAWAVQSTSFVNDIWKRFIRKDADDPEMILVGRVAVVVVGLAAMAIALAVALTETEIFGLAQALIALVVVPLYIPTVMGLLIRRTNRFGGLAGLFAALAFGVLNKTAFGLPFEWEIVLSTAIGIGAMYATAFFGVSPEYKARVDAFFERMHTPRALLGGAAEEVPAPLGVVGSFMLLIGLLMLLLGLAPQPLLDRLIVFSAAAVLCALGYAMRRKKAPAPTPAPDASRPA